MGVPSFYRWLSKKYPNIVAKAREDSRIDTSSPNPNGIEFDNLYLDMNGIIHPCFHPDDLDHPSLPTTFDEVFNNIYEYIDHIFSIVRPRKLLYMAIDGVAPRAKMNQQRSRRFRTAKDNEIEEAEEDKMRKIFEMEGKQVLPKPEPEVSDSNIITPGTEFMYQLSKKLEIYIDLRMNTDPGWKDIQVIISDANVPGEGEHKIMSFIRNQRSLPNYNPNIRHCLYGLDADLIMLALATHEVHFSILREDVLLQEQQPPFKSALETSLRGAESCSLKSRGWFKDVNTEGGWFKDPKHEVNRNAFLIKKPHQFLHVWILREYLEIDMKISDPPEKFTFDVERIIDDFVFMCFFVGNDFLPHMPTLEIHEGANDLLMAVYKQNFKKIGGYLVDMQRVEDKKAAYIKLKRVEKFILLVGTYEEQIFKKRSALRERKLRQLCEYSDAQDDENEGRSMELDLKNGTSAFPKENSTVSKDSAIGKKEVSTYSRGTSSNSFDCKLELLKNTKELKEKLKSQLRQKSDLFKNGDTFGTDKVKLGTAGWKERYYKEKFSVESLSEIEGTRKEMVLKYTEGLLWVLLYYFSGVPSWTWFYPYHYAPFASDMKGLAEVKVQFQKGSPFKPFDQLMAVLPPRSSHALPKAYQSLMTDESLSIIDFYPTEFEVDMDGKRFAWQGICKLPFIDEKRLLPATSKLEKELTKEESNRNIDKVDKLFARRSSYFGSKIWSRVPKLVPGKQKEWMAIDTSGQIGGFIHLEKLQIDIQKTNVLCVLFELPTGSQHIPRPLEGVQNPDKTITEADIEETMLWHEYNGSRLIIRMQSQERFKKLDGTSTSNSSTEWRNSGNHLKITSSSCSEFINKGAGYGWGAGRGTKYFRQMMEPPRKIFHEDSKRAVVPVYGSTIARHPSVTSGGKPYVNKFVPRHGTSPSNEEWRVVDHSKEAKGINDLKISVTNQNFRAYGSAQTGNSNNFWPSGNRSTHNNYSRKQILECNRNPTVQSYGRGQWRSADGRNSGWQCNPRETTNPQTHIPGRDNFARDDDCS